MRFGSLVLCFALAPALGAQSVEKSYKEARPVLDAGIKAMGGLEALQAVKDVWRTGNGTAYNQGQSLVPEGPLTTRALEVTSLQDFAGRRSFTETVSVPTGAVTTKVRAVLTGDTGFGYSLVTKVLTPLAPGGVTASKAAMRRDPAILLLTAASRADTLRSLGTDLIDRRKHNVITFSDLDGTQIGLVFDAATGLLSKSEILADNAVLGDALTENMYTDYREAVAGPVRVKLPARIVTRVAGDVVQDLKYSETKVNGGAKDDLFDRPKEAQLVPAAAPAVVTVTKLGEDAYLAAGGSHNSVFVAFKDYVIVVEAPLSEERSLAVLAKIAETVPGKPIKYVVPTHFHFDHSGGLRTYIAKGITIVTTPGNKAFLERMAAAPHTIKPDSLSREPKKAVIETFTGKRVFSDGARTLEVYDIGPNPHVTEAVVAYLPKEKTVFVADLLTIPADGPYPPAGPALVDFAEKIKKLGLAVDTIAPAHGRIGTMADLQAALAVPVPKN